MNDKLKMISIRVNEALHKKMVKDLNFSAWVRAVMDAFAKKKGWKE